MKILMVQTFHFRRGGDSTYMLALTRLLEEHGHEVVHFAMKHPENLPSPWESRFTGEIDFPALLARRTPAAAWKVLTRSIWNPEARRNIAALADETRPDIAHFHNIHGHLTTSIIGPLNDRGIPIVWTCHDCRLVCPNSSFLSRGELCERCLPARYWHVVLRRCKKGSLGASVVAMLTSYWDRMIGVPRRVERFITPSRFVGTKLAEGRIDPARITSIPNFTDLTPYPGVPEGDYFVYFGRLLYEKGIDTLIRAAGRLPVGRLELVGEGPLQGELEDLARREGGGRVGFRGFRTGDELRRLISGAQFVVVPSRWYENLPFSVMEAMAAGKAVVAADIGGIPEMVEDGVTGLLYPVGDEEALRAALERLIADPALRAEMGRRGREKAERLYEREGHYRRIIEVYDEVLGSSGHSPRKPRTQEDGERM